MKKILLALFVLSLFSSSHSSPVFTHSISVTEIRKRFEEYDKLHYPYTGPRDSVEITGCDIEYCLARDATTLGQLAKTSDIIAIGRVVQVGLTNFIVNVETALVGCTNKQPVTLSWAFPENDFDYTRAGDNVNVGYLHEYHYFNSTPPYRLPASPINYHYGLEWWRSPMTPDKDSLIVFCAVTTNTTPGQTTLALPTYYLLFNERSWWYADCDNRLLTGHFKKIVRVTRIKSN